MAWYLYLLECADRSIYTGIAVSVEKRFEQHKKGKGARYTRSHAPLRVLASVEYPDRSSALKAEYAMKQLSAEEKRAFCDARRKAKKASARGKKPSPRAKKTNRPSKKRVISGVES